MFDSPRPANPAAALGNYIQPNLGHGLRIWWAFYWPTFLSTSAFVVVLNTVLSRFLEDPRVSLKVMRPIVQTSKYDVMVFYYLAAFFVMAYLLRKDFRLFRIGLLSNRGGAGAQTLPPTLRRTFRVWWTFSWRTIIYRLIATFLASFPLGWTIGFLAAILPRAAFSVVATTVVPVLIDGAVGMYVIYSNILDEDISDFRVALLPLAESSSAFPEAAAPVDLANSQR